MELFVEHQAGNKRVGVSVVMATLGGDSVSRTIGTLNAGRVVPVEILVCIPEEFASRVESLTFPNLKVIRTKCRGQVAQRAIGFQHASCELVLQLDDDISLRYDCLEKLIGGMGDSRNVAVAPKMYDIRTGKYHAFLTPEAHSNPVFRRLLFWVVNGRQGYKAGQIGRAGISMGVPEEPDNWSDIGWLPGGCVLHRRENLVLFNYYPFMGKAFAEDLFHSALLKKKGIRLLRCGSAACDVDFAPDSAFNFFGALKWYRAYATALREFMKQNGGSPVFLYLFLLLNLTGHVTRKITRGGSES
jgi:GT2 family glycosyltransferase